MTPTGVGHSVVNRPYSIVVDQTRVFFIDPYVGLTVYFVAK